MKRKILKDAIQSLKDDGIYTSKDDILIQMMENTYNQYMTAVKEVNERGQVLVVLDYNKNKKIIINPSFNNQLQLQKELLKMLENLYLTPKSRKLKMFEEDEEGTTPFEKLLTELTGNKNDK